MVRAWIADVSPLYEKQCYERYFDVLPDFRKKKAENLRKMEMKAQSVGAWILWEKIKNEYSLAGSTVFNLSHSGTFVMCAAELETEADTKVGCDIEQIGPFRMRLAEKFFCMEEYKRIMRETTEEKRRDLFYRYWVLKESFMKATRKGMALPLDSFCIRIGNPPVLLWKPEEFPESFFYREYSPEGIPCKMAVCATNKMIDKELHMELTL